MYQRMSHRSGRRDDESGGPRRLLIESRDPTLALADFTAFRRAGFEITLCQGPEVEASECPLVAGEPCPLAADAEVVLFDLDFDCARAGGTVDGERARRQAVLDAMRAFRPDLPIVVKSATPPAETTDVETIRPATSVSGQVDALRRACARG